MRSYQILQSSGLFVGKALFLLAQPAFALLSRRPRTRVLVVAGREQKVLLVRNYIGDGIWDLPGGGVAPKESSLDAARRELYEETALDVDGSHLEYQGKVVYHARYRASLSLRLYSCELPQVVAVKNRALEIAAAEWFSFDQLPACSKAVLETIERAGYSVSLNRLNTADIIRGNA